MKMRSLLLVVLLNGPGPLSAAPPSKAVSSKIDRVTVFSAGASVTRTARASMNVGKTELVFGGISPHVDRQSLQVRGEGAFTILSVTFQAVFNTDEATDSVRLETKRQEISDRLQVQQKLLAVFKQEEALLLKNQNLGGTSEVLKAETVKAAADFQRARLTEVLLKQVEVEKTIRSIQHELKALDRQQTQRTAFREKEQGEIRVLVSTPNPVSNAEFELTYFVGEAGWTPSYDLRVRDVTRPFLLAHKANVFQFSGEDWSDVKLTISNAEPGLQGDQPALKPWYWGTLNDYSTYLTPPNRGVRTPVPQVSGRVTDAKGQPLPGVSVTLPGTSLGTTADANGYYRLDLPPHLPATVHALRFTSVGYLSQERRITGDRIDVSLSEDAKALNETIVVGYAAKADRALARAAAPSIPLEVEERQAFTTVTYTVREPYSVPSDGRSYRVELKESEIPAAYAYVSIPKITPTAFLTANVVNWEQYGLLPGEVHFFFEDAFLGTSALDLENATDTLQLSLGRDASVLVSRTPLKKFSRKTLLGTARIEEQGYELQVRNTKKTRVYVVLEDQFPLSRYKEIEVGNREAPEAEVDADTGKITWRFWLEPGQERINRFSYTVKAPRSGQVSAP